MVRLIYYITVCIFLSKSHFSQAQESVPCQGNPYDLVLPFMGQWQEFDIGEDEVFIGTLTTKVEEDGCSISQHFESADGSFTYRTFGYVDASSGRWKEIYVFSNGRNSEYEWFQEGNDVIMRRTAGSRKLEYMHQLRLTRVTEASYDVIEEHSYDKGASWKAIQLTRTKKVK